MTLGTFILCIFVAIIGTRKIEKMEIITSREFRDKQALYLNKVDQGEQIILQRGRNKSYRIVPITDDDTLMSKEEFLKKIDKSLEQIQKVVE